MAKQNKGRKFFAASATAALVASAIVPVASAAQVNDYNKISGYAKEAVQSLVDAGVIQGDTNGNFNPLNTVTRAQAAEIFTKALELEADGDVNFSDVKKGAWYYNSIAAVVANGIFEGVSAKEFAPNKSLTRSEAAKVLVDAFGLEGSESLSQFADASQVKPWAKDALETAVANGIFTGSEENGKLNLKPNAAITRQDFAVVFARTLDLAVETVDASVKAINNTTVEVTFDEEVDNVEALKFKIEGLEVKNAAVKQTNKKVVVLTTEAQTADKEYVVTLDGEEIGKFKGIEAVVPKSIVLKTTNTQGKVGNQVTLTADVGVKAAGIPVTFNVDAPTGSLNKDAVVEVYTNAEGIASYSYTQYAPDADDVTVYPTGAPQLRAFGTVYWGVDNILTIEEVTTGNTLANGVKKTYKVTFKDPKTGAALTNKKLNVSFVENTNVAFNAISKATVTNPSSGLTVTPYQTTTGLQEEIQVTTDSNGQATFVVSGTNTAVTPYVFVDGSSSVLGVSTVTGTNNVTQATTANKKWEATELTATAAQVKFEGAQLNHQITVERDGEEEAAAQYGSKLNGREYKVKVLDKDGKPYANGLVNIGLDEVLDRNLNTNSKAQFANVTDGTALTLNPGTSQQGKIKLNSKGEATVVLYGAKGEVGTPVVWIDQNTSQNNQSGVLEDGEPFFKAPVSNFQYERVMGAEFTVEGKTSNQNVGTDGIANYAFALTNQSGKTLTNLIGKMTYEIRNTSGQPIEVKTPISYRDQNNVSSTLFKIEEYGSITISADVISTSNAAFTIETAPNGKAATVVVTPSFVTANNFDASADNNLNGVVTDARDFNKYVTAPALTATFGNNKEVGTNYTGTVQYFNKDKKTITFNGKNAVKYAGESGKTYKYFGLGSTPISTADDFITQLQNNAANGSVTVTYKVVDNEVQFYIVSFNNDGAANAVKPEPTAVAPTDGTVAFTNTSFNASANQTITVTDADLNADATVAETTTVKVTSGTVVYTLTATETGVNTGVFTATLTAAQLAVLSDGVITATYEDVKNTTGSSVTRTATATLNTVVGQVNYNAAATTAYSEGNPVAATLTGTGLTQVIGGGALVMKINGTQFTTNVTAINPGTSVADSAAAVAGEINAAAVAAGIITAPATVATVNGTNNIVITSPTAAGSTVEVVSNAATGTGLVVASASATTSAPVKAAWKFTLTTTPAVGEKITVKVGNVEKTYTVALGDTLTTIETALNTAFGTDFDVTLAAGSNVFTVTQDVAAPTTAELTVTITK